MSAICVFFSRLQPNPHVSNLRFFYETDGLTLFLPKLVISKFFIFRCWPGFQTFQSNFSFKLFLSTYSAIAEFLVWLLCSLLAKLGILKNVKIFNSKSSILPKFNRVAIFWLKTLIWFKWVRIRQFTIYRVSHRYVDNFGLNFENWKITYVKK